MSVETIFTNARIVTARFRVRRHRRGARRPCRRSRRLPIAGCRRSRPRGRLPRARPGRAAHRQHGEALRAAPRRASGRAYRAVMAHDTQIAAAGITTVFDSLSLGDVRGDTDRVKNRDPHGRGDLRGERAPAGARRASPAPALRGHARRRRAGGRSLDRPAAGRPDLDQRPHAGPAPVPRSGEAQAVLHGQVRHDRGAVRGLPRPRPRAAHTGTPPAIATRSWRAPRRAPCRSPATTTPPARMSSRRSRTA